MNRLAFTLAALAGLAAATPRASAKQSPPLPATPALFAAGIVSTAADDLNAALTPDGKELYWSIQTPGGRLGVILVSRLVSGRWSQPAVAPFSGRYADYDPYVSPDGSQLFFISQRPDTGTAPKSTFDIWVVTRTAAGWTEPRSVGAPVNTDAQEFYPTVTRDGTLYFVSTRAGGMGRGDVFRARLVNGQYAAPENLGDSVNTQFHEGDPYIAPDESFLVFASYGRADGLGDGDLYISVNHGGVWSRAAHLPAPINSSAREYCPIASPDGKTFFFTSYRGFADSAPARPLTYAELTRHMGGLLNGLGNVYAIPLSAVVPGR